MTLSNKWDRLSSVWLNRHYVIGSSRVIDLTHVIGAAFGLVGRKHTAGYNRFIVGITVQRKNTSPILVACCAIYTDVRDWWTTVAEEVIRTG